MSVRPVVRWIGVCARCGRESAGEFVNPEQAQSQAAQCTCVTRGVPYVLTGAAINRTGTPSTPHGCRALQRSTA
jgi:hypothetical protein